MSDRYLSEMRVERAVGAHAEVINELFERTDCPCHCQYFGFSGDHRQWQMRCANDRATNRLGLAADLQEEKLTALVALNGDQAVGWMRIDQPHHLSKTYEGRLYRGLPCFSGDRDSVWSIACFLVDKNFRRRGVAAAMLGAAIEVARSLGATALEGLPRGAHDVSDEEQWTGPQTLYERAGFAVVSHFAPYPVYRLALATAAPETLPKD